MATDDNRFPRVRGCSHTSGPRQFAWQRSAKIARYRPTANYRGQFYQRSGDRKSGWSSSKISAEIAAKPCEHLHLLLRDNVAHEEPGIANNKQIAADRFAALKRMTVATCSKALSQIAKRVKESS